METIRGVEAVFGVGGFKLSAEQRILRRFSR